MESDLSCPSTCSRRTVVVLLCPVDKLSAARAASAAWIRLRKYSASMLSSSRHDQTRAVICELGLYAAQARNSPCALRTGSVSPLAGAPSTRSTAPENIHGWRRSSDFSRPALRMTAADSGPSFPVRVRDGRRKAAGKPPAPSLRGLESGRFVCSSKLLDARLCPLRGDFVLLDGRPSNLQLSALFSLLRGNGDEIGRCFWLMIFSWRADGPRRKFC